MILLKTFDDFSPTLTWFPVQLLPHFVGGTFLIIFTFQVVNMTTAVSVRMSSSRTQVITHRWIQVYQFQLPYMTYLINLIFSLKIPSLSQRSLAHLIKLIAN